MLRAMLDLCPDLIYFKDRESRFLKVSRSLAMRAGVDAPDDLVGKTDADIFDAVHADQALLDERAIMEGGAPVIAKTEREVWLDGRERWVTTTKIAWRDRTGAAMGTIGVSRDITDLRKLEMDLHQAQKLESIGRLAAGVAHEINTPVQFVSDSVHFVRDAVADLTGLIDRYQNLRRQVAAGESALQAALDASAAEEAADLAYLLEHVPKALTRSLDGLDRVATIVRSMKEFAHPDQKEMTLVDLNRAVASTLVIARNEYKYVADVETSLGEMPLVRCHGGDVNQAMLNIIVNAAHAIADIVAGTDRRGTITVRTWHEGEMAVVSIADTGGGIPQAIQDRVFDPFFTTKEVGRGTGQGLAIARTVVVEKHRGDLSFECAPGVGTTFVLRLPIESRPSEQSVAAEWAI
jgi:PAS domain S-box-containing protein